MPLRVGDGDDASLAAIAAFVGRYLSPRLG